VFQKIAKTLMRRDFVRKALEDGADLSAFRQRPSPRVITGIVLMAFSYVLGWPAVAFFGVLAVLLREPLVAIIGGPVIYGISHLVFLAGFYCAGAGYSLVFARWATRKGVELLMKWGKEQSGTERA
jgi:hypothetical protein